MQKEILSASSEGECGYRNGKLPSCAPLAVSFVPPQQDATTKYDAKDALMIGTLFPGLDLPFKNVVNTTMPDSPEKELMALDFVAHELALYLDTHPGDSQAFALYRECLKLAAEGKKRYTEMHGPVLRSDMIDATSFTWIKNPWPWEYTETGV